MYFCQIPPKLHHNRACAVSTAKVGKIRLPSSLNSVTFCLNRHFCFKQEVLSIIGYPVGQEFLHEQMHPGGAYPGVLILIRQHHAWRSRRRRGRQHRASPMTFREWVMPPALPTTATPGMVLANLTIF